jgi:hypothetical protein
MLKDAMPVRLPVQSSRKEKATTNKNIFGTRTQYAYD